MRYLIQIGTLTLLLCGLASAIAKDARSVQQDQTPPAQTSQSTPNAQSPAPGPPDQNSQQSQAPDLHPPTAPEQPQTAPSQPATQANPEEPKSNAKKPTARKKAGSKKKGAGAHTGSQSDPGKVVVRNGGAQDNSVQLSPEMSQEQALHSRENTTQLLATTDQNVKAIEGHQQLSATQQSMLDQIHAYVRQSKAASASGDFARARTLAYKAHLLSDELARE